MTTDRGLLMGDHITLGALGDSFFEYLLKQWLLTGEEQFHRMYREFVKGMKKHLIARSSPSNLVYVGELKNGQLDPKFDHLVCFVVSNPMHESFEKKINFPISLECWLLDLSIVEQMLVKKN